MDTKTKERTAAAELHDEPPIEGTLMHRDTSTGAAIPMPARTGALNETPLSLRDATFDRVASNPVTSNEDTTLRYPANEDTEIDILPTGEVYMSHVFVRRRLNDAFMPMGWALRPLSPVAIDPNTQVMYREYALVVKGIVVATAFGSTKYQERNERMDFADAAEAVRSNALTRCSKDLGIGSECWDPRFCERWKQKYAVHVWTGYKDRSGDFKVSDRWRRADMKPARGEFGLVTDTPNAKHKAIKPFGYDEAGDWQSARELLHQSFARKGQRREPEGTPGASGGGESTKARNVKPAGEETASPSSDAFLKGASSFPGRVEPNSNAAKHLIKDCKILKRGKSAKGPFTLHLIKLCDGREFTTFDTTVYDRANKCWAARILVDIEYEEADVNGKRVMQIPTSEHFKLWKRPDEPGSDG